MKLHITYLCQSIPPLITTCFSPCDTEHHTITQQDPPGIAEGRSRAGDQSAWRAGTDCGGWRPLQAPVAPAPPSHRIAPFWDACETQDPLQERLKCGTCDVTLSFPCAQAPRRGRGGVKMKLHVFYFGSVLNLVINLMLRPIEALESGRVPERCFNCYHLHWASNIMGVRNRF
jgi:hypothetical protein